MTRLNSVQISRCPACGHLIPKDRKTCPYCGNVEIQTPAAQQKVQRTPSTPQVSQSVVQASQQGAQVPPPVTQTPQQENQWTQAPQQQSQWTQAPQQGNQWVQPFPPAQPVAPPPTTSHTNKGLRNGLIIGGSLIVAAIVVVLAWSLLSDARVLKQSILKPLTQKQLEAKSKSYPQLIKYATLFSDIRNRVIGTPDEATYQSVSYEQMISYLDFLYSNSEQAKLRDKAMAAYADYRKPYDVKFQTEADRWTKFYNEHDPSAYLDLTFHTRYESEDVYYYTRYYPAFWIDISYPKGAIKDCEVFFGLWSDEFEHWYYSGTTTLSLEGLKECTRSADYYFQHVSRTSQDIYDDYSIKYEVRNVTLRDGTTISLSDRNEIPREMLQYIEEQTPENKGRAILALVDSNFLEQAKYVSTYTEKYCEKKDKLCYDLLSKMYGDTMIPSLGQN